MVILGIETSCDETAAAVIKDGSELLSNVVASSADLHAAYGGVVPEIAARSHVETILPVIDKAVGEAYTSDPWQKIDAIAVTHGPGLAGSLLVGVMTAKSLALAKNKPLYAVNHVKAHVEAAFLTKTALPGYSLSKKQPHFPLLALIVSGGHTLLAQFSDHQNYKVLGQTTDDAVGEAFDKVAKMLGLPYPGGPSLAALALKGDPQSVKLPTVKVGKYSFSFSGLKTAVLRASQKMVGQDYTFPSTKLPKALNGAQKANIAASFQQKAVIILADSLKAAVEEYQPSSVVVAGGVAANLKLRQVIDSQIPLPVFFPDVKLCTDNAAMVAQEGYFQIKSGLTGVDPPSLDVIPNLSM
ncbi:MAG: tRNA (adenosine(37)-N6)-threonylcarbamoyltransferase complex transferase subunit TsaD [Candidatus Saccharimonadales bacterium]